MRKRNPRRAKPKGVVGVCMRNEGRRERKGRADISTPYGDTTARVGRLVPLFLC
jgi:hypothetical protein